MKQIIINILSFIFQALDSLLCKCKIKHPIVIMYMDGGICSQMNMYIQGQYYAEYGMDVRYDISWYHICGKDSEGIMPRTFELKEMWPKLEFKTISELQRKWYLLFFRAKHKNEDWLPEPSSIGHSIYFYGYWDTPLDKQKKIFAKCYNLSNATEPRVGESVDFKGVIGVHIRRGDLAKGDNPNYGGVSEEYFNHAIEFCNKEFSPLKFLFFSDEPDWVEQNICPQVKQPYEIIRGNKGWEDLWLLAHCPVIVASQGSFGRKAAQLNTNAILIQCDNEYANREREKTFFIK